MSNPRNRTLPDVLSMYFVMLVVYCCDLFFLKSDLTILGDYFYSRFVSLAILLFYIKIKKQSLRLLGISKDKRKNIAGLIYGSIFSVLPVFLVTLSELFYYVFTDVAAIELRFETPNLRFVRMDDAITPTMAVVIYMLTTFLASLFKELFFRGFVLKRLNSVMDFKKANFIQAVLYMSFILPYLLRNLVNNVYDETTTKIGIFIVAFYLVHETLAGIKWGLLTRVTGCTYVAIIDHFFYVFLSNSIFITNRYVTWSFMLHMLAIQLVSLILVLIYYKINLKKIAAKKAEKENSKKIKQEKEIRIQQENIKKDNNRKAYINEKIGDSEAISPGDFRKISDREKIDNYKFSLTGSDGQQDVYDETVSDKTDIILNLYDVSDDEADRILDDFDNVSANKDKTEDKSCEVPFPARSVTVDNSLSDEDVDEILERFSRDQTRKEKSRGRRTEYRDALSRTDEISEDFDVDKFLSVYQDAVSWSRQPHHSLHHRHHKPSDEKQNSENEKEFSVNETAVIHKDAADCKCAEPQNLAENGKHNKLKQAPNSKKPTWIQKVKALGEADVSDSNDLI